jgi:FkbM family methyltransferase
MPADVSVFLEPEALRINHARQQHLASLGLDLERKRVLEVGAGIGLHTAFFEQLDCDILSTDANPTNVGEMLRSYPNRNVGVLDLDRAVELDELGAFDVVYCYGTLYHLQDPEGALARLSGVCSGQILIETIVALGEFPEVHRLLEPLSSNQAIRGVGTRPTRPWVMSALRRHFGHAYTTLDQPDYPDFVTDWETIGHGGNLRAIFVGSKCPLTLSSLTAGLPRRHRNAPLPLAESTPRRVWIDVGAYRGEASLPTALDEPGLVIHAFEPVPELYGALAGARTNYIVHPMAVSDHNGMAPFRINRFTAASSLLPLDAEAHQAWIDGELLAEEHEIVVPTVRLDTFMDEAGIGEVEFLKIDAQGADFAVVQSLGNRLRDIRRIKLEVAVTHRQLYIGAADKETIVAHLEARGFELTEVEPQSYGQEENLTFIRR